MGQLSAACAPTFHGRRTTRNGAEVRRQELPHEWWQPAAERCPPLSTSTRAPSLCRGARVSFSLLVALLLVVVQSQSGVLQTHGRPFLSTPCVEALPMRGSHHAVVRGGRRHDGESFQAASSGSALYSEEPAAVAGINPALAASTAAVQPASSSWSMLARTRAAASPDLFSANPATAAAASVTGSDSATQAAFRSAVVAPAASMMGEWNQANAAVSTHGSWEKQEEQHGAAATTFEHTDAAFPQKGETRLLAPAGADVASAQEQEAAGAVEPVLGAGPATEGTCHNSTSHPQQPSSSVLFPRSGAPAAAGVPPDIAATVRRTAVPATALPTRGASANPESSRNTNSDIQTRGSSSSATADVYTASRRTRQQSIRRHTEQSKEERFRSLAAFAHLRPGGESHRQRKQRSSAGAAGMLSPVSSFDSGYEDEGEEEMGLTSSQGFGQKLREALSCPASKILIGVGGAVAVGTLGVKYTRALLKRRRRQKLQQRPPTPFSDLLGHVLLVHEKDQEEGAQPVGGVLRSAKGKWGNSGSKIVEAATADVLGDPGSVTALYFTSSAVEEMLQQRGYLPFTTRLEAIAEGCKRRGQKLQVVYVSADADARDAAKHFAQMPWCAVPYDDAEGQEIAQRLYRRFRVSTLPHVVLFDSEARVINPQAYASMLMDPGAFPWKKKTLRELLGDTFVRPDGEKVDKSALGNKVLGLYFSASWCPPCQAFTPNLVNAAQTLREQGKNFEIVFISNDKNQQQFDEYFKKMTSFLAIPFKDTNKRALVQETLNIRSLPALVWVGPDDEVLTRSGVAALAADRDLKSFPFKDADVHEVAETVEGIAQEPALIVFMEYADPADQQKQQAALEAAAAALRGQKRDGGFPPVPLLFTASKISPRSTALRRICKQHEVFTSGDLRAARQQQAPVMVIVDLIDQSYYLYKRPASNTTVDGTPYFTADEITTFVRDFRSETLERNPLILPE